MTMPNSQGGSMSGTGAVSDPAAGTTGSPSESTSGARGQIRQVKDQVVDQAKSTLRDAREKATSSLADSRVQAAEQIGGVASAFHSVGAHLREENQERIANLAESLAGQVDQVAGYLRQADMQRLARDVEGLARRRPALVFGAAFALGLIGARFLKSTESGRSERFGEFGEDDEEYASYERIQPGGDPAGIGLGTSRSMVEDVPPVPRTSPGGPDART